LTIDRDRKAGQLYTIGLQAVHRGGEQIYHLAQHLPLMIKGTVDFDGPLWPERALEPDGRIVRLNHFIDYLLKPARDGLGLPSLYFLKQVLEATEVRDGGKALDLVRKELKRADGIDFDERAGEDKARLLASGKQARHGEIGGGHENRGDNITSDRGTSAAYTAARLARDRPDLSARTILPKKDPQHLSINAAAIEAGFRKLPSPLTDLRRAWQKASEEERRTFLDEVHL
jgi:hypothetical protein